MTFVKALLKISTLLVLLLIANYFVSLEASKLYPNTSRVNVVRCIETERQALLKFKDDVVDYFGLLYSWSGPYCCTWEGVGCRYPTGEVVWLHLTDSLRGKISNHLNELKHLRYLNLSYNVFSGLIPPQLGNLSNLQVLDLSEVGRNSYVSDLNWISSLSSLKFLDLTDLNLSLAKTHWVQAINTIPSLEVLYMSVNGLDTIPLSLSQTNLTSLTVLDLSYNTFNTQTPQWLSNLTTNLLVLKLVGCGFTGPISMFPYNGDSYYKLEVLNMSLNNFSGELPDSMEHLKSLRTLDLSMNSISGPLPDSMEHLKSLRTLDLSKNYISGPLPISIGKLSKLESLDLSDNNMNGIPKSLGRLEELKSLNLLNNKWEGVLSQDHFEHLLKLKNLGISSSSGGLVVNLSCNWVPPFSLTSIQIQDCDLGPKFPKWLRTQTQFESIVLQNVSILDTIPGWLWNLSLSFVTLILSNNQLRGSIPVNIGQMMFSLEYIDLSKNSLNGIIPFFLGNISSLEKLDLSNNHLSGEIHDNWENIIGIIDFSSNNLSGKIPSSVFSCVELKLNNNSLSGELPIALSTSSKSLKLIDLGDNKLCGTVPGWIGGSFTKLQLLRMRGNLFSGSISEQFCRLQSLHVLDLAQNNLSGYIPKCLSQLFSTGSASERSGMDLNLKGNKYTYETSVLRLVKAIDLSCNNLCGYIPENITTIVDLGCLNLSNNQLTGKIPSRIGDMRGLETLDLSFNHLYGQIPPSISSMTSLNHLNLSYNNLSGPIPSGSQLSTFDESIYEGNPGLCGSTFSIGCKLHNDQYEDNESRSDGKLGVFVSLALGFIFGFWSIFGTLAVKKSWRRVYFGVIDKIIDQIVVVVRVNLNRFHEMMAKEETN